MTSTPVAGPSFSPRFAEDDVAIARRLLRQQAGADLTAVKAIEPNTWDLAEWIRSTGWTAPADRVHS